MPWLKDCDTGGRIQSHFAILCNTHFFRLVTTGNCIEIVS